MAVGQFGLRRHDRIRANIGTDGRRDEDRAARRLSVVDLVKIQSAVAEYYGVDARTFKDRGVESISRDVAAWLSRQLTSCTLRELAPMFGLGHADSVRNLTRRFDVALTDSKKLRQDVAAIRLAVLKGEVI
jgi:chromosomal replication initiation ATPase DnaA